MTLQSLVLALVIAGPAPSLAAPQDGASPPATRPATQPGTRPAVPANEPPEVTALLDRVARAYAALSTLRLEGVVTGTFDAAGKQSRQELSFTSAMGEGGLFRHEVPDELIVAADGEATWVYFPATLRYYRTPRDSAATQPSSQLPAVARQALLDHDLSLLLALSDDPSAVLRTLGTIEKSDRGLKVSRTDGSAWELEFDPATHLLAVVRIDDAEALSKAGVPDVKAATREIRYQSTPGAAVAGEALAFKPPETAQEVEPQLAGGPSLAGAPAPELSLPDLEGKVVSLEGLRGKVVLVDFWATWCGPCVMAMPHLKTLAQGHAAEGFVVLAVNLREDEATIRQFVTEHELAVEAIMVLRDADGSAAERWGVQAIPFSVVVGRDGVVREVIVGLQPEKLAEAVKAALGN